MGHEREIGIADRMACSFRAIPLLFCLGCADDNASAYDGCFGADSILAVDAGHIGSLRLDLPLESLRLRCPRARDTVVSAFETRDTAIVIHDSGITAIAHFATVEASDDGDRRPVSFDGSSVPRMWDVSGHRAVLPGGVRLNATWREARAAWGVNMDVMVLNGMRIVTICDQSELRVLIPALGDPDQSDAAHDSLDLAARIELAQIPPRLPADSRRVCP